MNARIASRLTARLGSLELGVGAGVDPAGGRGESGSFVFGGGRYTIRVANDLESRSKAYQLIYRLYVEKEYARPAASGMWLSLFDGLPETTTLLAERTDTGAAVGALTVVFDSGMGLPAGRVYGAEIEALRRSGRRLAEVISLGVSEEAGAGGEVLVKLFNHAYFVARGLRGATDFVITVNPRHVRFYERLMLFSTAGPAREYDKVGGAPAVLMRLDFDVAERQRVPGPSFLVPSSTRSQPLGQTRGAERFDHAHRPEPVEGSAEGEPGTRNQELGTRDRRSIYGQFRAVAEEPGTVAALAGQLRPMTGREFDYFLSMKTDVLTRAEPEQRGLVRAMRASYERESAPVEPFSLK